MGRHALLVWALVAAGACGGPDVSHCGSDDECPAGQACRDAVCVAPPDAGAHADAGTDAECMCGPGEVCHAGRCTSECGDPEAVPCGEGRVCDFASGQCADAGTPGILTGEGQRCGESGPLCLPGTECGLDGACAAAPPCSAAVCNDDRSVCWGRHCLSERPAGACTPAPLERMNMDDFLRGGDGGAFDFELDDACNAYVVTMISGTDYLRQLSPDGTLSVWDGVTNLNMGEVAVHRLPGGEFGTGDGLGEVALTYVCCASCGCISGDPQGVARLDRAGTTSLPMVIVASPSTGEGPFQNAELDTGPYGLTWGRDNTLYVGNVEAEGDLVRADLDTGEITTVHTLPARVHASAVFSARSLLVATDEGVTYRVATDSDTVVPWADVGEDVTSLVRDPFTGHVFVSVTSARILEYAADGTLIGELEAPGSRGRLAYSPDGYLYYLISGWPTSAEVLRYALPTTL